MLQILYYINHIGTGKLLGGLSSLYGLNCGEITLHSHMVAKCNVDNIKLRFYRGGLPDFVSSEQLGIEIPSRCKSCKTCKECNFQANQLTYIEQKELEIKFFLFRHEGRKAGTQARRHAHSYIYRRNKIDLMICVTRARQVSLTASEHFIVKFSAAFEYEG